jgi:N12 class adenine-specific DNA methylase
MPLDGADDGAWLVPDKPVGKAPRAPDFDLIPDPPAKQAAADDSGDWLVPDRPRAAVAQPAAQPAALAPAQPAARPASAQTAPVQQMPPLDELGIGQLGPQTGAPPGQKPVEVGQPGVNMLAAIAQGAKAGWQGGAFQEQPGLVDAELQTLKTPVYGSGPTAMPGFAAVPAVTGLAGHVINQALGALGGGFTSGVVQAGEEVGPKLGGPQLARDYLGYLQAIGNEIGMGGVFAPKTIAEAESGANTRIFRGGSPGPGDSPGRVLNWDVIEQRPPAPPARSVPGVKRSEVDIQLESDAFLIAHPETAAIYDKYHGEGAAQKVLDAAAKKPEGGKPQATTPTAASAAPAKPAEEPPKPSASDDTVKTATKPTGPTAPKIRTISQIQKEDGVGYNEAARRRDAEKLVAQLVSSAAAPTAADAGTPAPDGAPAAGDTGTVTTSETRPTKLKPGQRFHEYPDSALVADGLREGDEITTSAGDKFTVLGVFAHNRNRPDLGNRIDIRWDNGKEVSFKPRDLESVLVPHYYYDANTGERKLGEGATIQRAKAAAEDAATGGKGTSDEPPVATAADSATTAPAPADAGTAPPAPRPVSQIQAEDGVPLGTAVQTHEAEKLAAEQALTTTEQPKADEPDLENAHEGPWEAAGTNAEGETVYRNPKGRLATFDAGVPWLGAADGSDDDNKRLKVVKPVEAAAAPEPRPVEQIQAEDGVGLGAAVQTHEEEKEAAKKAEQEAAGETEKPEKKPAAKKAKPAAAEPEDEAPAEPAAEPSGDQKTPGKSGIKANEKPQQTQPAQSPSGSLVMAPIGDDYFPPVQSGQKLRTQSGRDITVPTFSSGSNRADNLARRKLNAWLADETRKEVAASGADSYLAGIVAGMNPKNMSQTDRDTASDILFGADGPKAAPKAEPAKKPAAAPEAAAPATPVTKPFTSQDIGTKVRPKPGSGLDPVKNAGIISHVQTSPQGPKISVNGGPHFLGSDFERVPEAIPVTPEALHDRIIAQLQADTRLQAVLSNAEESPDGARETVRKAYRAALGQMLADADMPDLHAIAAASDALRDRPIGMDDVREITAARPGAAPEPAAEATGTPTTDAKPAAPAPAATRTITPEEPTYDPKDEDQRNAPVGEFGWRDLGGGYDYRFGETGDDRVRRRFIQVRILDNYNDPTDWFTWNTVRAESLDMTLQAPLVHSYVRKGRDGEMEPDEVWPEHGPEIEHRLREAAKQQGDQQGLPAPDLQTPGGSAISETQESADGDRPDSAEVGEPTGGGPRASGAGARKPKGNRPAATLAPESAEDDAPAGLSGDGGEAGVRPGSEAVGGAPAVHSGGDAATGRGGTGDEGVVPDGAGGRTPNPAVTRPNFHIDDPKRIIGGTGPKQRFARNRAALKALEDIQAEGRDPTQEELETMAGFIGWGSFGQEVFQGSFERQPYRDGWEEEGRWLREHLGKEAWDSARDSIRNAHYTDPPTVAAMWDMVRHMGFWGGRVLEPSMGVGNFFGLMPRDLMGQSDLTGIEKEKTTGEMAKLLYPHAGIHVRGYEESKTADNFYDLVIGNWPFAAQSPPDRRYDRLSPSLHNYFFLKALDQVRPGGLVVGITSNGTMDSAGRAARLEMAKKGKLIAAFRLPSGAFKDYAGTSVVADIIILQKRAQPLANAVDEPWIDATEMSTGHGDIRVNRYFQDHPENVLGTLDWGHGTTSGRPGMIVHRPDDLEQRLQALAATLPTDAYQPVIRGKEPRFLVNNTTDRHGSIVIGDDGHLYQVQGERLTRLDDLKSGMTTGPAKVVKAREDQVRRMVAMRKAYGALIDAERDGKPEADTLRKSLKAQYDQFRAEHGPIGKSDGLRVLDRMKDPGRSAVESLERPDGTPSPILTEPTVRSRRSLENPSIADAFVLARNEQANFDLDRVAELTAKPRAAVEDVLLDQGAIMRTPGGGFEATDDYLSGNVRRKLREAKEALAAGDEKMQPSIDALTKVLPPDTPYYNIEAKLGATWVGDDAYRSFIGDLLNLTPDQRAGVDVRFTGSRWRVRFGDRAINGKAEARTVHGHEDYPFNQLIMAAMGNRSVKITYRDDDNVKHTDDKATEEVNAKVQDLKEKFTDWAWSDPERKVAFEQAFNETMNAIAKPRFDGSFMDMSGMALRRGNDPFSMRRHQLNAIWRGVALGRGLFAHEVGTGKSYTMAGIAVEGRRYGKFRKPVVFAHGANSAAVAQEFQDMYPGGKFFYISTLKPDQIATSLRRIANEDWDAVIMPHSLIDRMALTKPTLVALAAEQIAELENAAIEAAAEDDITLTPEEIYSLIEESKTDKKAMGRLRSPTAKDVVRQIQSLLNNIEKQASRASKEDAVPFEQLGIDAILVDEAHEFKKPPFATAMKMRGLNTQSSDRSIALDFLTKYVKANNAGKGVFLFTGTPVTNTLNEIFNMARYFMDDRMADAGIKEWDAWFNTFADATNDIELTSTGEIEPVKRLAAFNNVDELVRQMSEFVDVVQAKDMPEFKPRPTPSGKTLTSPDLTAEELDFLMNGRTLKPEGRPYVKVMTDVGEMSPAQVDILDELRELAREFKTADGKQKKEWMQEGDERVPIRIETNSANTGIDPRLYNPDAPDTEDSKINRIVRNVLRHYGEPDAAQAIFLDRGFNPVKSSEGRASRFVVVDELIAKLVEGGIPREQIAVVAGGMKAEKKKEIADGMNSGKYRIAIGQSGTLGVGVNMQERLRAIHHFDAPWRPGDLEQRNGRMNRQGNTWNMAYEYRYVTEGIDGRRWQVLQVKDKFIKAFIAAFNDTSGKRIGNIEGDAADMSEDEDFSKTLSAAAGDPRIMIRAKYKADVERLQRRERLHTRGQAEAIQLARSRRPIAQRLQEQAAAQGRYADRWEASVARAAKAAEADGDDRKWYEIDGDKAQAAAKIANLETSLAGWDDQIAKARKALQEAKTANNRFEHIERRLDRLIGAKNRAQAAVETVRSTGRWFDTGADLQDTLDKAITEVARGEKRKLATVGGFDIVGNWSSPFNFFEAPRIEIYDPASGEVVDWVTGLTVLRIANELNQRRQKQQSWATDAAEKMASIPALEAAGKQDFPQQEKLTKLRQQLAKLEDDLQANPNPPPSWLRNGAPIDTDIYVDGEPRTVRGHRVVDDYFLVTDEGEVPYLAAMDANGLRMFTVHEPPQVVSRETPDWVKPHLEATKGVSEGDPHVWHGELVWHNRDLALIRGTTNLWGPDETAFLGFKKGVPAEPGRNLIGMMSPKGFKPQEWERLGEARDDYVAREANKAALAAAAQPTPASGFQPTPGLDWTVDETERWVRGLPRGGLAEGSGGISVPLYSAVQRAADALKQAKGTGQQMLAQIVKTPGVKPEEIEWMGLDDWLKSQPSVTKQQIQDFVAANRLEVREVTKGDYRARLEPAHTAVSEAADRRQIAAERLERGVDQNGYTVEIDGERLYHDEIMRGLADGAIKPGDLPVAHGLRSRAALFVEAVADEAQAEAKLKQAQERVRANPDPTKFGGWLAPFQPTDQYREIVFTLPAPEPSPAGDIERLQNGKFRVTYGGSGDVFATRAEAEAETRRLGEIFNKTNDSRVFRGGHWSERNVVAHVRFDVVEAPDGARVLMVHEVQSDWHQAGRKKGYQTGEKPKGAGNFMDWTARQGISADDAGRIWEYREKGDPNTPDNVIYARWRQESDAAIAAIDRWNHAVPDAPYKTTWPTLVMRRTIKYAVDNGFDRIAWSPGAVHADRYDLSKQISRVEYDQSPNNPEGGSFKAFDKSGRAVINRYAKTAELPDMIGKAAADKLLAQKPEGDGITRGNSLKRTLRGLDLKVGGEGMTGFYDDILPKTVQKIVGKYGARVGKSEIPTGGGNAAARAEYAQEIEDIEAAIVHNEAAGAEEHYLDQLRDQLAEVEAQMMQDTMDRSAQPGASAVHSFDITPALRDAVRTEGMALFERKPGGADRPASPAPATKPTWATPLASDINGTVAWQSKGLALIQGHSISGKRIYVPAKEGIGRASVDLDSYTGKHFTPDELARLKAARDKVAAAEARQLAKRQSASNRVSPWPDGGANFTDLLHEAPEQGHGEAGDWTRQKGIDTNHEHIAVVDNATGRIVHAGTNNQRREVDFPHANVAGTTDTVTLHHNHPNSTGQSREDTVFMANPGVSHMVVHGHDGSTSITTLGPNAGFVRSADDIAANGKTLGAAYDRADATSHQVLRERVIAGDVSEDVAGQFRAEVANRLLNAEGIISYVSTRELVPAIKLAVGKKLRSLGYDERQIDRSTGRVRPEERVASLPRPVQGGPGPEREADGAAGNGVLAGQGQTDVAAPPDQPSRPDAAPQEAVGGDKSGIRNALRWITGRAPKRGGLAETPNALAAIAARPARPSNNALARL